MKLNIYYLIFFLFFLNIETVSAGFVEYYNAGMERFKAGDYKMAECDFKAALVSIDAPVMSNVKDMIFKSSKCKAHLDTADNLFEEELYSQAFIHFCIISKINKYDKLSRTKMSFCVRKENSLKNMVYVPAGKFIMGNNEGGYSCSPAQEVDMDGYYIDKNEVSNDEYALFLNIYGTVSQDGLKRINLDNSFCGIECINGWYYAKKGMGDMPVVAVSWYGANDYAKWQNKSLPTEAQWEYAFRDSEVSKDTLLHSVNTDVANSLGVYDMSGNVREWCSDWYWEGYFKHELGKNPEIINDNDCKSVRGGAYNKTDENVDKSERHYNLPQECLKNIGFRCVKL